MFEEEFDELVTLIDFDDNPRKRRKRKRASPKKRRSRARAPAKRRRRNPRPAPQPNPRKRRSRRKKREKFDVNKLVYAAGGGAAATAIAVGLSKWKAAPVWVQRYGGLLVALVGAAAAYMIKDRRIKAAAYGVVAAGVASWIAAYLAKREAAKLVAATAETVQTDAGVTKLLSGLGAYANALTEPEAARLLGFAPGRMYNPGIGGLEYATDPNLSPGVVPQLAGVAQAYGMAGLQREPSMTAMRARGGPLGGLEYYQPSWLLEGQFERMPDGI